jgi:hypothetical protein
MLFYKLPGDTSAHEPVEADWLWREVNEGRITKNVLVCETRNGLWTPYTALTNDFFSDEIVSEAASASANLLEAEQLHLQATFRLHKCQAHLSVYHSRSAETIQQAKNGIEFVDAALKLFPRNQNYLNTKALLFSNGLGQTAQGLELLKQAGEIAPNDIQIKQNFRTLSEQSKGCFGVIFIGFVTAGIYIFYNSYLGQY